MLPRLLFTTAIAVGLLEAGAAAVALLSAEPSWLNHVVVERDRPATMRDGVTLSADVYRPEKPGRYPALLMRTPYNKAGATQSWRLPITVGAVRRGYVVVIQDTRGQYKSEGRFVPYAQEIRDGYDTIEWVATLPHVDGNVGMFGLSYPGAVQWMTAPTRPPHLKAIAPSMTFAHPNHFFYHGGVFEADFVEWLLGRQIRERMRLALPFTSPQEIEAGWKMRGQEWMDHRPLGDLPLMKAFPYWREWVGNPIESDYWKPYDIEAQHHLVQVPALNLTGWNDDQYGQPGAIRNFVGMRARGATDAARRGQRLVIGPWTHGVPTLTRTTYAGVDYGANAAIDYAEVQLRFFDYWLKGIDEGYSREAPVRIFVMGDNRWRDEQEWPPSRTQNQDWYLRAEGRLARDPDSADSRPSFFTYDPRRPVPVPPMPQDGPRDFRTMAARHATDRDVVAFTSVPLDRETEITGHIVARLWVASTAPDTDITCRILDVAPDGFSRALTNAYGALRARYRSTETPQPPKPLPRSEPAELEISLGYTSYVVPAGHRLQLLVAGSVLQGLETHLNTWEPFESMSQARTAEQRIYHDAQRRSRVIVPIIPR